MPVLSRERMSIRINSLRRHTYVSFLVIIARYAFLRSSPWSFYACWARRHFRSAFVLFSVCALFYEMKDFILFSSKDDWIICWNFPAIWNFRWLMYRIETMEFQWFYRQTEIIISSLCSVFCEICPSAVMPSTADGFFFCWQKKWWIFVSTICSSEMLL